MLISLLLGQFALGFGYGIAAERGNDEIKIPVCTSTGIRYVNWTPDGIIKDSALDAKPDGNPAAGDCTLCTVSPPQLRFDVQDALLPEPIASRMEQVPQTGQRFQPPSILNLTAPPRAPPFA